MSPSQLELDIWKELAGASLSVSHDRWHLDRVLSYALQLQQIHGGDAEVLTAAVLMHDLGRADPERQHGLASIQASVEGAEQVLDAVYFPSGKRQSVIDAINEHDQPELKPSSIEARILKDADFLAGFGAWGVLRIAMWSGETGRNTSAVLHRLEKGMPRRVANLEFEESRVIAHREMFWVQAFLQQLRSAPGELERRSSSRYIVLEGISGSGKDTQAKLLSNRLSKASAVVVLESEPTNDYRAYKTAYENAANTHLHDAQIKKWLLLASRERLAKEQIVPALSAGSIVVSIRSFISTLVYQCDSEQDVADTAYIHRYLPQPDVVVLMTLPPNEARARIEAREKTIGDYESLEALERYGEKYESVCKTHFPDRTKHVDAVGSPEEVAHRVWEAISGTVRVEE